mmetsp:Transcript_42963/g.89744  ORF Transcript_42963/g.89744 Transcript_42963/m.89744 type:complete len:228 (+) Transcript_42963:2313-2996(+)
MAVAALVAAAAAAATGGVGIDVAEEQHVVATDLLLAARLVGAGAQHPGKPDLTRLSRALAHRQQLGLHADHQNASHQGLRLGIGVRAGVRAGVDGVRGGGGRRLRFTCNRRCGLHLVERREQGEIIFRRCVTERHLCGRGRLQERRLHVRVPAQKDARLPAEHTAEPRAAIQQRDTLATIVRSLACRRLRQHVLDGLRGPAPARHLMLRPSCLRISGIASALMACSA